MKAKTGTINNQIKNDAHNDNITSHDTLPTFSEKINGNTHSSDSGNISSSDHNTSVSDSAAVVGLKKALYEKKKVGEDQNKLVRYASLISGNDIDWLMTVEAENGLWDMYRKHPKNRNGTTDWGCGLNSAYHKPMIEKIKAKSVTQEKVLEYCREVYLKRKTAFYGYKVRLRHKNKFYLTTDY